MPRCSLQICSGALERRSQGFYAKSGRGLVAESSLKSPTITPPGSYRPTMAIAAVLMPVTGSGRVVHESGWCRLMAGQQKTPAAECATDVLAISFWVQAWL
jgi:hypothetical protein